MSRNLLIVSILIILGTHLYYPKWSKTKTEATISWDVSGYYLYLPAIFIYKDLRHLEFGEEMLKKYSPTPDFQQVLPHEASGNYVMKYSAGQAVMLLPGFMVGHTWASLSSSYEADGFSFPYQLMISMWVLLITICGLILLRKVLLNYFGEMETGLAILGIVLGSNYLNYAAIDGAMTHNTLFTVYALLILVTIQFYKKPSAFSAVLIGSLVGLAALTRPTEIIAAIIPTLWGVNIFSVESLKKRLQFFRKHIRLLLAAIIVCGLVGLIQLIYWKYATGDWIVYSYGEQGFSWLRPHIKDGILSFKSGWLTYSPFMVFSLIGFFSLYRIQRSVFGASLLFTLVFIYICFAWDVWWYGGALGQRAMVQSYPVLAFPIAAFFTWLLKRSWIVKIPLYAIIGLFFYANVWFTHQAHLGGMIHVGQMRKAYFWKTLLTWEKKQEHLKLLDDVNVIYDGPRKDVDLFYSDTSSTWKLSHDVQFSELIEIPASNFREEYDWFRVSAKFTITDKEWFFWTMTQFVVEVYNGDERVGLHMIRVQRHMDPNQSKVLYIDIPNPDKPFTELKVKFWNADGNKSIEISDLMIETYLEG